MSSHADTSSHGTIDTELHCVSCGYDLRGLEVDSNCPECSTDVQRSLRGDDLRYADPKWLRNIGRGLTLIRWSLVLALSGILGFVAFFMMLFFAILVLPAGARWLTITANAVMAFCGIACCVSLLAGAGGLLLVVRVEPRESELKESGTAKSVVRLALATALCAILVGSIGELFPRMAGLQYVAAAIVYLSLAAIAVAAIAGLAVIEQILGRTSLPIVKEKIRVVRRKSPIAAVLLLGGAIASNVVGMMAAAPQWLESVLAIAGLIGICWTLALTSQAFSAIGKLRNEIQVNLSQRNRASIRSSAHSTISKSANSNPGATTHPNSA